MRVESTTTTINVPVCCDQASTPRIPSKLWPDNIASSVPSAVQKPDSQLLWQETYCLQLMPDKTSSKPIYEAHSCLQSASTVRIHLCVCSCCCLQPGHVLSWLRKYNSNNDTKTAIGNGFNIRELASVVHTESQMVTKKISKPHKSYCSG